ncbi:MAG TPA: FAD-binding oxidoreductase [Polyangiaceae bacterium]
MAQISELNARISGRVLSEAHPEYDRARSVWNGTVDKHPRLIVECGNIADVIAAVGFARQQELGVSVRGGGHHVAGSSVLEGGLVLDLAHLRRVSVDPERRTARVEGGATLGDVDRETQAFGLAVPLGVVSATGVAGLTLAGGLGWLRRKHGLTCDNLLSADVVTADGQVVHASPLQNPDLFWALRGGGWDLGAVSSFEFQAHPIGPEVFFTFVTYAMGEAREVLRRYREYMDSAPPESATLAVCWTFPEADSVPSNLWNEPFVGIVGPYAGDAVEGERVHSALARLGTALTDQSGCVPWTRAQRFFDEDYPRGRRYYWRSAYISALSEECIARVLEIAESRPSPLSSVDVWPLGGVIGARQEDSPLAQRNAPWAVALEANWEAAEADQENIAWVREAGRLLQPLTTGAYMNFADPDDAAATASAYGKNLERLRDIKRKFDPDNLFRSRRGLPMK